MSTRKRNQDDLIRIIDAAIRETDPKRLKLDIKDEQDSFESYTHATITQMSCFSILILYGKEPFAEDHAKLLTPSPPKPIQIHETPFEKIKTFLALPSLQQFLLQPDQNFFKTLVIEQEAQSLPYSKNSCYYDSGFTILLSFLNHPSRRTWLNKLHKWVLSHPYTPESSREHVFAIAFYYLGALIHFERFGEAQRLACFMTQANCLSKVSQEEFEYGSMADFNSWMEYWCDLLKQTFLLMEPESEEPSTFFHTKFETFAMCEKCCQLQPNKTTATWIRQTNFLPPLLNVILEDFSTSPLTHLSSSVLLQHALNKYIVQQTEQNAFQCSSCNYRYQLQVLTQVQLPDMIGIHVARLNPSQPDHPAIQILSKEEQVNSQLKCMLSPSQQPMMNSYRLSALTLFSTTTQHYILYIRGNQDRWYVFDDTKNKGKIKYFENCDLSLILSNKIYCLFFTRVD